MGARRESGRQAGHRWQSGLFADPKQDADPQSQIFSPFRLPKTVTEPSMVHQSLLTPPNLANTLIESDKVGSTHHYLN